jgi:hypothetical protein
MPVRQGRFGGIRRHAALAAWSQHAVPEFARCTGSNRPALPAHRATSDEPCIRGSGTGCHVGSEPDVKGLYRPILPT